MHNRLAAAIRDTETEKLIARTVPEGSDTAVTVVGLSSPDAGHSSALGKHARDEDEGDRVDLWLEIPRVERGTGRGRIADWLDRESARATPAR